VQEKFDADLRDLKLSNLRVSWKGPVSNVVSHDHRQTQGQLPFNLSSKRKLIRKKRIDDHTRWSLLMIEYKRI